MDASREKKRTLQADYWRETFFLPPLKMVLTFFEEESRQNESRNNEPEKQEGTDEQTVVRLIEKLSEKEE